MGGVDLNHSTILHDQRHRTVLDLRQNPTELR
jgi:hypothetical protein